MGENVEAGYPLSVTRYIDAPPAAVWDIMTNRQTEGGAPNRGAQRLSHKTGVRVDDQTS